VPRQRITTGRPAHSRLLGVLIALPLTQSPAAWAVEPAEPPADLTEPPADLTEPPADLTEPPTEPAAEAPQPPAELPKPPRVDGPYLGAIAYAPASFVRVRDLDTSGLFPGIGGSVRIGESVLPWLTVGLEVTGSLAYHNGQRLGQGALIVDFGLLPVPRIPLSIHLGFGVGGGAVRQKGVEGRSGFGGAVFKGAVRYDIFPLAARKRPRRGGGFSLGPELGWIGFTPAVAGRPMSNTIYLGLGAGFYFGS